MCPPEAAEGGPIALVEEGDLIQIDIPERVLRICGLSGKEASEEEISAELARRRANWQPKSRSTRLAPWACLHRTPPLP